MYQAKENLVQLSWRHISVPSSSDRGDPIRARIRVIPRKSPGQSLRKWSGRLRQITKVIKPNKFSSILRASEQITAISRTSYTIHGNEHCIPRSQAKCSSDLRDSAKQPNRTKNHPKSPSFLTDARVPRKLAEY
jgi:hypothetical protein